jgi:hypothetical protein
VSTGTLVGLPVSSLSSRFLLVVVALAAPLALGPPSTFSLLSYATGLLYPLLCDAIRTHVQYYGYRTRKLEYILSYQLTLTRHSKKTFG